MMKQFLTGTLILGSSLFAASVIASPKAMVIHNLSDTITNAYVDGVAGPEPTEPNATSRVRWFIVKAGCRKHTNEGICPVVIKMDIESDSPIVVGTIYIDLESGMISPQKISGNGFAVTADGPAEVSVKND